MTKKEATAKFLKMAKKRDWDDLAYDIIIMEEAIRSITNSKQLNLLELKLTIWEAEKASRIFQKFNMKTFLTKSLDDSIIEY